MGRLTALLLQLEEVGLVDQHVAFHFFGCVQVSARWLTLPVVLHPPKPYMSALKAFDLDIHSCFSHCTAVDTSNQAWQQAELSLSRGGLGLCSISRHSPAAYIASLSSSGFSMSSQQHLKQAVEAFNSLVPTSDAVCIEDELTSPFHQKMLSTKVDNHLFNLLLGNSSPADRARLLSVSSPHAASWILVIPSEGLGLHLELSEFPVAIKWWLGHL